mmetsp:Transcript_130608/g.377781  ORF Transcript_130608/g.377781 Transcript_130608/m.377781 type:complete len:278 (-) Transcript_130608:41-874(-)
MLPHQLMSQILCVFQSNRSSGHIDIEQESFGHERPERDRHELDRHGSQRIRHSPAGFICNRLLDFRVVHQGLKVDAIEDEAEQHPIAPVVAGYAHFRGNEHRVATTVMSIVIAARAASLHVPRTTNVAQSAVAMRIRPCFDQDASAAIALRLDDRAPLESSGPVLGGRIPELGDQPLRDVRAWPIARDGVQARATLVLNDGAADGTIAPPRCHRKAPVARTTPHREACGHQGTDADAAEAWGRDGNHCQQQNACCNDDDDSRPPARPRGPTQLCAMG